jgi:Sortase domain
LVRTLGNLLFLIGGFLILLIGAVWLRSRLAAEQPTEPRYLTSRVRIGAPLPAASEAPVALDSQAESDSPAAEDATPVTDTGSPVIRVVIPHIAVDQSVIPVGLRRDAKSGIEWDSDALFSTENRRDLVGQLITSVNPGEVGNIILIGHNYNGELYNWEGVFLHLGDLQPGNQIVLYTRDGGKYIYSVQKLEKVPSKDLKAHEKYLWPTPVEQLTLVTCGGPNYGRWSFRVYVFAYPVK